MDVASGKSLAAVRDGGRLWRRMCTARARRVSHMQCAMCTVPEFVALFASSQMTEGIQALIFSPSGGSVGITFETINELLILILRLSESQG